MTDDAVRRKLKKAKIQVLRKHPFFGQLLLHLKEVPDPSLRFGTMATDAVHLFYNPAFVEANSVEGLVFALQHEVMHVALAHPMRRKHRDAERWCLAAEHACNATLADSLKSPGQSHAAFIASVPVVMPGMGKLDAVFDPAFLGMSAEAIYSKLPEPPEPVSVPGGGGADGEGDGSAIGPGEREPEPEDADDEPDDDTEEGGAVPGEEPELRSPQPGPGRGGSGGTAGPPGGLPPGCLDHVLDAPATGEAQRRNLEQHWKMLVVAAAEVAKQRGKLPGCFEELLEDLLTPQLDWRERLRHYLTEPVKAGDYTRVPPNRRFLHRGLVLPSLTGRGGTVAFVVDTSGSMGMKELRMVFSEVQASLDDVRGLEIMLIQADAAVADVQVFRHGDSLKASGLKVRGRGGTDFGPAFQRIEEERMGGVDVRAVVYLSDLYGSFPDEPDVPVLWVTTPKHGSAPWGEQVELTEE